MININYTLLLTIINFLILVYVLKKLLWGPLTKFLDDRAEGIEDAIRATEVNREEAQHLVGRDRAHLQRPCHVRVAHRGLGLTVEVEQMAQEISLPGG